MKNHRLSWILTFVYLAIASGGRTSAEINESQLRDKLIASTVVIASTLPDGQIFMGTVEVVGFTKVSSKQRGKSYEFYSDIVGFKSENLFEGASGCAIVNSIEEVVGCLFCRLDSFKDKYKTVLVREIQQMTGARSLPKTSKPKSLVGRWVVKSGKSEVECGLAFGSDEKYSLMSHMSSNTCEYRVTKSSVGLKSDGQSVPFLIE